MSLKVKQIAYHRNGITGLGFHAVLFSPAETPGQDFLATVFEEANAVAVVRLDIINVVGVEFGKNSYRCEAYEADLRAAIAAWRAGENVA